MKPITFLIVLAMPGMVEPIFSQELVRIQNGAMLAVQKNADLTVQGDLILQDGSILVNYGVLNMLNPAGSNDFVDSSTLSYGYGAGALVFGGSGVQLLSSICTFGRIEVGGTGIGLGSDILAGQWWLVEGLVNNGGYRAIAIGTDSTAVEADPGNAGFSKSWFNGTLRRYLDPAATNNYIFPVGNASGVVPAMLDNLTVTPLSGTAYLDVSFGPKPGTDRGLAVSEDSVPYIAVAPTGVWHLIPDATPTAGAFDLLLSTAGFGGLTDNEFGILRRPDASSTAADWMVPPGSTLPAIDSAGRTVASGYARREHLNGFGQFGIGITSLPIRSAPDSGGSQVVVVYPNPARWQVQVRMQGITGARTTVITDMAGRVMRKLQLTSGDTIDMGNLATGIYVIRIYDAYGPGKTVSKKLLVTH
jgi:hypothetical protein